MKNRLFLAIKLPIEIKEAILSDLKPYGSDYEFKNVRWTLPENLHITLLFLGNVQDLDLLTSRVQKICHQTEPFELLYKHITFAPSQRRSRMIWLEFHENEAFFCLAKKLASELKISLPEVLRPHITLARFPFFCHKKILFQNIEMPPLKVERFFLMHSDLTKNGPHYQTLSEFLLVKP